MIWLMMAVGRVHCYTYRYVEPFEIKSTICETKSGIITTFDEKYIKITIALRIVSNIMSFLLQ